MKQFYHEYEFKYYDASPYNNLCCDVLTTKLRYGRTNALCLASNVAQCVSTCALQGLYSTQYFENVLHIYEKGYFVGCCVPLSTILHVAEQVQELHSISLLFPK